MQKTFREQCACRALRRCPLCGSLYPFAPGAIEFHPRHRWSRAARISAVRGVLVLIVMGAMAAITRLLTGGLL